MAHVGSPIVKRVGMALLALACLSLVAAGCHVGEISAADQQSKVDRLNAIAKSDPTYAQHTRR